MVGGSYCQLPMPLKLALAAREAVAGRRLGALGGGSPPANAALMTLIIVSNDSYRLAAQSQ